MIRITDNNRIPELLRELEYLDNHGVQIGVLGEDDSFIMMIASVHEFGATIKPKGKYLTIPLRADLRDVSPRDLNEDLFVPKGTKILARKANNDKGFEALYALVEEVKIPERSYIRTAFDENKEKLYNYTKTLFGKVLSGEIKGHEMLDRLGLYIENLIKKKIKDIKEPPKSPATLNLEGSGKSNPLIDTGRLRRAVVYKVVSR